MSLLSRAAEACGGANQLAKKAGISHTTVTSWKSGRNQSISRRIWNQKLRPLFRSLGLELQAPGLLKPQEPVLRTMPVVSTESLAKADWACATLYGMARGSAEIPSIEGVIVLDEMERPSYIVDETPIRFGDQVLVLEKDESVWPALIVVPEDAQVDPSVDSPADSGYALIGPLNTAYGARVKPVGSGEDSVQRLFRLRAIL